MRRPALPISIYLRGDVLLVAEGPASEDRLSRLMGAGARVTSVKPADFEASMCQGEIPCDGPRQ